MYLALKITMPKIIWILGALGYLFGAVFAWICQQSRPQIVAISLETAIQNGGIAFVVMNLTFPSPYRYYQLKSCVKSDIVFSDLPIYFFTGTLVACLWFHTSCVQPLQFWWWFMLPTWSTSVPPDRPHGQKSKKRSRLEKVTPKAKSTRRGLKGEKRLRSKSPWFQALWPGKRDIANRIFVKLLMLLSD